MKKVMILLLVFVTTIATSRNFIDDVIKFFDDQITEKQDLRQQNALIKSKNDMAFYAKIKDATFPLNYLNDSERNVFINSLSFNEKGLTSFSYKSLENLDKTQKYKILSLFGFEDATKFILKPNENKTCLKGMKCGGPLIGYKCISKGTCQSDSGYACTNNC